MTVVSVPMSSSRNGFAAHIQFEQAADKVREEILVLLHLQVCGMFGFIFVYGSCAVKEARDVWAGLQEGGITLKEVCIVMETRHTSYY